MEELTKHLNIAENIVSENPHCRFVTCPPTLPPVTLCPIPGTIWEVLRSTMAFTPTYIGTIPTRWGFSETMFSAMFRCLVSSSIFYMPQLSPFLPIYPHIPHTYICCHFPPDSYWYEFSTAPSTCDSSHNPPPPPPL